MHMRLAFAVAAHLEPEILIIDEVLAVGDINFQSKCLGKMQDVSSQGRTVLFVSHNMGAIGNLCSSAMWLNNGRIASHGEVRDIIAAYVKSSTVGGGRTNSWKQQGGGYAVFTRIELLDRDGTPSSVFAMGDTIVVECDLELLRPFPHLNMSVDIKKVESGLGVLHLLGRDSGFQPTGLKAGKYRFRVEIPNCLLYPGSYSSTLWLQGPDGNDMLVPDAVTFSMTPSATCSKRTTPFQPHLGVVHMPSVWRQI
jgi:lipopolysaccharide transport system ATP-binding protein